MFESKSANRQLPSLLPVKITSSRVSINTVCYVYIDMFLRVRGRDMHTSVAAAAAVVVVFFSLLASC